MAAPKISERLREFTQPTGEEELLAVDYPRPRLRISPWQACAVAVILVIGVVVWLGINARSEESSGMPEPAAMSSGAAPSGEPSEIIVSVIGEVAEPGLKTLEPGARVADALDAAQPLPGAETMALNHAQRLSDGQQLHILPSGAAPPPAPGEPAPAGENSSSPGGSASSSGVSLNSALNLMRTTSTQCTTSSWREVRQGFISTGNARFQLRAPAFVCQNLKHVSSNDKI